MFIVYFSLHHLKIKIATILSPRKLVTIWCPCKVCNVLNLCLPAADIDLIMETYILHDAIEKLNSKQQSRSIEDATMEVVIGVLLLIGQVESYYYIVFSVFGQNV